MLCGLLGLYCVFAERIAIKMFTHRSVKNVYIKYYKLLVEQL